MQPIPYSAFDILRENRRMQQGGLSLAFHWALGPYFLADDLPMMLLYMDFILQLVRRTCRMFIFVVYIF